ncbi:hypothetical protein DSUL_60134 [Desulfovibrionales bacterium]
MPIFTLYGLLLALALAYPPILMAYPVANMLQQNEQPATKTAKSLTLPQIKAYLNNYTIFIRNLATLRKDLETTPIPNMTDATAKALVPAVSTTLVRELTATINSLEQLAGNCFDIVFLYYDYLVQEGKNSRILAGYVGNRLKQLAQELRRDQEPLQAAAAMAYPPSDLIAAGITTIKLAQCATDADKYLQWIDILAIKILEHVTQL